MTDIDKLNNKYDTINKYLKILDEFDFEDREDFNSKKKDYLAVSMSLFVILNNCIEVGEIIIEFKEFEFPSTYRKIFEVLKKEKVLSTDLANNMSKFMHQRNMIAHQYDDIDFEDIYKLYNKRDIFNKYIEETKRCFIK